MRREKTKRGDLTTASGATTKRVRSKTASGWNGALLSTPECATEQIEHSWLASLELDACTCTAWTTPVKATNSTHSKARDSTYLPLPGLSENNFKWNVLPRWPICEHT